MSEKQMLLKDKSLSFSASEEPCNLYNSSIEYRNERLLTIGSEKTEYQLKLIAAEIRLRNMIIQQEIYFIGEMTTHYNVGVIPAYFTLSFIQGHSPYRRLPLSRPPVYPADQLLSR